MSGEIKNLLIDSTEFRETALRYINSGEFDSMINSTIFRNDPNARAAILLGFTIATMLTARCKQYMIMNDQANQEDEV